MTIPEIYNDTPHRRYNPLAREWVLVAPHRAKRPWSGKVEKSAELDRPQYDPKCYLCPGNTRASGDANPDYTHTYVFDNDFASLLNVAPAEADLEACNGLIKASLEQGICRVICFSPRHDLTLAEMETAAIAKVVQLWTEQYEDLGSRQAISHVLIFENKGELMGCSNPHPHGQIWANHSIPSIPARKIASQLDYFKSHQSPLLMDYLAWEQREGKRIVLENDHFVALVPFWAVWPFETLVLPKRQVQALPELSQDEQEGWADIIRRLAVRYDNVFNTSFPYSMGINQLPTDGADYPGLTLHQAYYPPLLRSATVKKFQVGYEMSAEPQRDLTPEQAAIRLQEASEKHFRLG